MSVLASLLVVASAAPATGPLPQFDALYGAFASLCRNMGGATQLLDAANKDGWTEVTVDSSESLRMETAKYVGNGALASRTYIHKYFKKELGEREVFAYYRTATDDGVNSLACEIHIFNVSVPYKLSEMVKAIGQEPEFQNSDFGGESYDFGNLDTADRPAIQIEWLTHRIRPGWDKDKAIIGAFEQMWGPRRPPTFTIGATIRRPAQ